MIITGQVLIKLGIIDGLLAEMDNINIQAVIFDEVIPNPTYMGADTDTN